MTPKNSIINFSPYWRYRNRSKFIRSVFFAPFDVCLIVNRQTQSKGKVIVKHQNHPYLFPAYFEPGDRLTLTTCEFCFIAEIHLIIFHCSYSKRLLNKTVCLL